jgi:hypothetical protein
MSALGERQVAISLDDARTDFLRYVKTEARRVRLASQGFKNFNNLQIAAAEKGVGSRLRAMFEMPVGMFVDHAKMMQAPVDVGQLETQMKAAVSVGGIDVGWGGVLAPFAQASVAFLQSLAPYSAFDRILNDNSFFPLPMRTRIAVMTTAATGSTVPEDTPKPVASMAFTQAQQPALKAIAEVVLSDEVVLMTTPSANRLFEIEMQKSVALATDQKFNQILVAGAGTTHASTGTTAAAVLSDLTTALQSIQTEVASKLYFVVPVNTYKALQMLQGTGGFLMVNGKIGPITVLPSSGATTNGILFDAANAVGADSDMVTPDTSMISNEATLVMQDNPTAGDTHIVSLWQQNWTAIRYERFFSAVVLRANGVTKITGYS